MNFFIKGCDRPLSRKKLRQLMWNRKDLTANRMAAQFDRKPGMGRFKKHLLREEMELERQEKKMAADSMAGSIKTALLRLMALLQPKVGVRKTARAARTI